MIAAWLREENTIEFLDEQPSTQICSLAHELLTALMARQLALLCAQEGPQFEREARRMAGRLAEASARWAEVTANLGEVCTQSSA